MLNFRNAKRFVILGGGTAGWFAAIAMRRVFSPNVEIRVIESSAIGIVGVGEGGLLNLAHALKRYQIPIDRFMTEVDATYKWGFCYEGWRTGKEDDRYFHLFAGGGKAEWAEYGFLPGFSALIGQQLPLPSYIRGFQAVARNVPQQDASQILAEGGADIQTSYHFDSYKTANFLKTIALERGIVHQDAIVDRVELDQSGNATALFIGEESLDVDFVIDASGFARKIVGNTLNAEWVSFKEHLLMDRAIPFYMPHPFENPLLVTRALAMNAGWMWQIPLVNRVGAGYVYSSKHISDERALAEIEQTLGYEITPHETLKFDPGCFKEVWHGNIMALGLSSGFVEPLEATSIGQMLEQLRNFERVLSAGQGIVSDKSIKEFNQANLRSWEGIRDFLRMHYDCPRRDNQFWCDVTASAMPDDYRNIKACWQKRTPRMLDIENYAINGWGGIFHVTNWMFVAAPLGLISTQAAKKEVLFMPQASRERVSQLLQELPSLLGPDWRPRSPQK
ncbi:tryptophan 7-halogenase [Serratia fonticola]|uniref:Tryptophan 7-halogenase n=1 Tax=Serratia fonticola TaxID=47917 RepID=A0AAJ1YH18_SERFO|nr:tryptophan 7-halogenase [Serratia fonticola]MDQ9129884.1 tryptophan 7-halogenase [Serratia fonticola]